MRTIHYILGLLVFGSAEVSCGGRTIFDEAVAFDGAGCVPGQQVGCACLGGVSGVQVCLPDSTFGSCDCGGGSVSGSGAGPSGGAGSSGGTGSGGGGSGVATVLSSGSSVLIDVFVADPGVFIVLVDTVMLVDRKGQTLQTVTWPRDITSAALDGETLVVADKAKLTTLGLDLNEVASADLVEMCASSVLVTGSRFVCGPENDWDRVFYTYDAKTGALLANSDMYTYNGIPMRRVPGTDDFVTVTVGSSPSDFHLYSIVSNGEAVFVNESPYHGDFAANNTYAFDGSPPAHLITHEGLMLKIYGSKCNAAESSFSSECFLKDGSLGTLTGSAVFLGMDSDASGMLYGLVDPSPDFSPSESQCPDGGCLVQRIDVAAKMIQAQSIHPLDVGEVIAARHDSVSSALVVGYRLSGPYYFPDDSYPGYRVSLLRYE